jgi:hypothetical protein
MFLEKEAKGFIINTKWARAMLGVESAISKERVDPYHILTPHSLRVTKSLVCTTLLEFGLM